MCGDFLIYTMYTVVFECHSLYFVPHKGEMKRNERGKEFWSLISRTSRRELHSRPPLWMRRWLMCAGGSVQSKWAHAWRGHSTLPLTHRASASAYQKEPFPCLCFLPSLYCSLVVLRNSYTRNTWFASKPDLNFCQSCLVWNYLLRACP